MPAVWMKYSAARCVELPTPAEAKGIFAGAALAASTSALSVVYGPLGLVTMT